MRHLSVLLAFSLGGLVACGSSDESTEALPASAGGQSGAAGKAGAAGTAGTAGKAGAAGSQGGAAGSKAGSGGAGQSGASGQSGAAGASAGGSAGQSGAAGQGGAGASGSSGQAGSGGAGAGGQGGAGSGGAGAAGSGAGGAGSGGAGAGGAGSGGSSGSSGQAGAAGEGGVAGQSGSSGQAGEGGQSGAGSAGAAGSGAGAAGASGAGAGGAGCETLCEGVCVDLVNDSVHCGACDNPCPVGATCQQANCVCNSGLTSCGGACVDAQTDANNCGQCGKACAADTVCEAGACVCAPGLASCGGGCVDLQSDEAHCGQCQSPCAQGATCEAGGCVCAGGGEACAGVCRDTKTDANNCGSCGAKCLPSFVCEQGSCQCPAGLQVCDQACVDLVSDASHCGDCAVSCPQGGLCELGACKCPVGTAECVPGQCVDTQSNGSDCGSCGVVCGGSSTCSGGVCSCLPGQSYCGGDCVDSPDCSLFVTKLLPEFGWQSGGNYITIQGGGFAAGVKVFLGDGRAPVRVVDDKTLRILTPPGPLGLHDVRIELPGGKTFTRKNGFRYDSGSLNPAWEQKKMQIIRGEDPGVAVMQDGRAIVAGGTKVPDSIPNCLNTAEMYDRATDTVTAAKNTMSTPRWQNSAITLLDGRVLVVGGACSSALGGCNGNPKKADLFDPTTDTFSPAGDLNIGRAYTRTVLLPDGRVLVQSANSPTLEVFDPATNTFKLINHNIAHVFGFMVRLRDGRVMFGSGDGGNKAIELFNPDTDTISSAAPVNLGRSKLTAHTLPDGRVILIGGASSSAGGISAPMDSMETYNPQTGVFTLQPYKLQKGRCWHASSLVRDGTILVMGGYVSAGLCSSLDDTVDQVDPVNGLSAPAPFLNQNGQARLPNKNCEWSATTLLDGSVLAVGGGACGANNALPDIDFLGGAF